MAYYDKLRDDVQHADTSDMETAHRQVVQQLKDQKKELEKITKQFNAIASSNVKKRQAINTVRKERTLFDHIFKTLEYQIVAQEKRVFELIEKNQKKDAMVKESKGKLENIRELVSKNKYEDFYKIIEKEKKKYMNDINSLHKAAKEGRSLYKEVLLSQSTKIPNTNSDSKEEANVVRFNTKVDDHGEDVDTEDQIKFYEDLFTEFKINTADENFELLESYMTNGDELNEELYKEFIDLENEYEELKKKNEELLKLDEESEVQTMSTEVTRPRTENNQSPDLTETKEEIAKLIVS